MAAAVTCPARRECPAYFAELSPARCARFFTTPATSLPLNRRAVCAGAVPFVRLIPFMVFATIAVCVGGSRPTALWASAMAFNLS